MGCIVFQCFKFLFFYCLMIFLFQCYVNPKPHLSQVSGCKVKCDHPTLGMLKCVKMCGVYWRIMCWKNTWRVKIGMGVRVCIGKVWYSLGLIEHVRCKCTLSMYMGRGAMKISLGLVWSYRKCDVNCKSISEIFGSRDCEDTSTYFLL